MTKCLSFHNVQLTSRFDSDLARGGAKWDSGWSGSQAVFSLSSVFCISRLFLQQTRARAFQLKTAWELCERSVSVSMRNSAVDWTFRSLSHLSDLLTIMPVIVHRTREKSTVRSQTPAVCRQYWKLLTVNLILFSEHFNLLLGIWLKTIPRKTRLRPDRRLRRWDQTVRLKIDPHKILIGSKL